MRSKQFPLILFLLSPGLVMLFSGIPACTHESDMLDDFDEICFEREVLPIFQSNCSRTGCHDGGGGESRYVFTTYQGILEAVKPGDPSGSPAYTSLTNIWGEGMMPPDQPLSQENRTLIRLWIQQGARYTTCPDTSGQGSYVNPRACFDRDILPVLLSSCAISNCHDNVTAAEGYRFTSYANTLQAVTAGYPLSSELYEKLVESDPSERMPPPPYSPLPDYQIDSIYSWISYGAPNEACGEFCDTLGAITFSGVIWPLIETNCRGCHSGTTPSGGISLSSYGELVAVANTGQLLGALKGTLPYIQMPPSGPLSDCRIRQVDLWIQDGAPNNK